MSTMTEKSQDKNKTSNSDSTKENKPVEALTGGDKTGGGQLPPWPSPLPIAHKNFVHSTPKPSTTRGGNALEPPPYQKFNVFTAGSIEMGDAIDWQPLMAARLSHLPITVCNPRRPKPYNWNPALANVPDDTDAKLTPLQAQIDWELDALEQATVICFFFDVWTKSPVSLLELGLWASSKKLVVCCGQSYHKSGNVKRTCERYNIPFVETFEQLVGKVEDKLAEKGMKLDSNGDLIGPNVHETKEKPH